VCLNDCSILVSWFLGYRLYFEKSSQNATAHANHR
jgi:hypothetical protein